MLGRSFFEVWRHRCSISPRSSRTVVADEKIERARQLPERTSVKSGEAVQQPSGSGQRYHQPGDESLLAQTSSLEESVAAAQLTVYARVMRERSCQSSHRPHGDRAGDMARVSSRLSELATPKPSEYLRDRTVFGCCCRLFGQKTHG